MSKGKRSREAATKRAARRRSHRQGEAAPPIESLTVDSARPWPEDNLRPPNCKWCGDEQLFLISAADYANLVSRGGLPAHARVIEYPSDQDPKVKDAWLVFDNTSERFDVVHCATCDVFELLAIDRLPRSVNT